MSKSQPRLGSRLMIGAIAGFAATLAMTSAMRRLHSKLPVAERYPLTPREIIDSAARQAGAELADEKAKDVTTAAHFAYGAASGAVLAAANVEMGPVSGAAGGLAIWLASYMGWIPAAKLLHPATAHPARRTLTMLAAHVVWGVATAEGMRELVRARETAFGPGEAHDAPVEGRRA